MIFCFQQRRIQHALGVFMFPIFESQTWNLNVYLFSKCLSHVWGFYIFVNLWILLRKIVIYLVMSVENFIFVDFLLLKLKGSDVNPNLCYGENT